MMPDSEKLETLGKAIDSAKRRIKDANTDQKPPASAARISIELLSGVVVGTVLGYYLDMWFGTSPIFFLLCFFFGVAGSGLNIYKIARKQHNDAENDV
jgi:ATP synthase protein I